jgi:hypothetical protein
MVPQLHKQGLHIASHLVLQQFNQLIDKNLSDRDVLCAVQSHV